MEVGILSMRYAKAIIEYAQEKGLEDRLYQEFLTLSHSFCEQPGLREALDNLVITTKEKLALVCTAADGDGKSTREFVRFITLVLRNRREGYLQFISLMYLDLYRKLKHIGVGKLITAVPVNKETENRIRSGSRAYLARPDGTRNGDRSFDRRWIYLRCQRLPTGCKRCHAVEASETTIY